MYTDEEIRAGYAIQVGALRFDAWWLAPSRRYQGFRVFRWVGTREYYRGGTPPVHRGETHPNAKLTEAQVRAIRARPYYRGVCQDLGKEFGVSHQSIYRIRAGQQRRDGFEFG